MKTFLKIVIGLLVCMVALIFLVAIVGTSSDTGSAPTTVTPTTDGNAPVATKEKAPAKPKMNADQRAAVDAAQNYVDIMPFSRKGLIRQLTSEFDGHTKANAVFAVNHIKVNYKEEALESAEMYQDLSPMSREGLRRQLSSNIGDAYTDAQADYAVEKVFSE